VVDVSSWRERRACCEFLKQGHRLSPLSQKGRDNAQLFVMSYRIAGIDVHKKMLAVVVANVEVQGEYQFERIRYGSNPESVRLLAARLIEHEVEEVVMESTAQYWKPVWGALERYWKSSCQKREGAGPMSGTLHLARARSIPRETFSQNVRFLLFA